MIWASFTQIAILAYFVGTWRDLQIVIATDEAEHNSSPPDKQFSPVWRMVLCILAWVISEILFLGTYFAIVSLFLSAFGIK